MKSKTRKPIDALESSYFICPIVIDGIPAQAATLLQPAEPDVGLPTETIEEILIFDRRGYYAEWLEKKLTPTDNLETQIAEAIAKIRYEADLDHGASLYEARADDRESAFDSYYY